METAMAPTRSEMRLPYISRLATSRPSESSPRTKTEPGGASPGPSPCSSGSWGARTGARAAVTKSNVTMAAPARIGGRRPSRRQARGGAHLGLADTGVEDRGQKVGDQIYQDEEKADHQGDPLHHRQVTGDDRLDQERAETGEREDRLDG